MLVSYTDICESQSILKQNVYIANTSFSYQQTPLHVAASKGRKYAVECLVQKRADMNIEDKEGVSIKLYLWSWFGSADLSLSTRLLTW